MAISLTPTGGRNVVGVATMQGATWVDSDTHTVYINGERIGQGEPTRDVLQRGATQPLPVIVASPLAARIRSPWTVLSSTS